VLHTLFGLPAHILIVHAAVVFIPLAALGGIVYAVVPGLRRHIWWVVVVLGVVAPVAAWGARLSGVNLRNDRLSTASGALLDHINTHQSWGLATSWWALGLGVALLIMTLVTIPLPGHWRINVGAAATSGVVRLVTSVVVVAVAVVTLYYVIQTGDSGSRSVWG